MRILIIASYNLGYFAAFIPEQAAALERLGCEVKLFGIVGKGLSGYMKELPRLRAEIRAYKPDVIHAHFGLTCLLTNLATRKIPIISTYHGSDIYLPKLKPISLMAIRLSAWNILVSESTMKEVPDGLRKRCSLVPCGIDLSDEQLESRAEARKQLGWGKDEKKVLFAGRFDDRMKNVELARSVIAIFGDAELLELKGYNRSQVNRLMCAANCLLMTSLGEASPQVIKEALACGCPIVSVDVGDVKERVAGVEGCYVVPSRAPKELAEALTKAMAFVGKTNGREAVIAAGMTNDLVAKKLMEIYEQV